MRLGVGVIGTDGVLSIHSNLLHSEEATLTELGLNDGSSLSILRDSIFARFGDLADKQTKLCSLDNFLKDCIQRGFSPVWGDAAFRAYESPPTSGTLNTFNYTLAIISLLADEEELQRNKKWLALRRRVVFKFYDTYNQDILDPSQFGQFLDEVSSSACRMQVHGIDVTPAALLERDDSSSMSSEALGQGLALCKVQLAEKTSELQELQLLYKQLEKRFCALKLELAEEKARKC